MPKKAKSNPRLFLDKLVLQGFKSIENLEIDLDHGINILIGKNGAGKSNFLDFIFQALRSYYHRSAFRFAKITLSSSDNHEFVLQLKRISQRQALENDRFEERNFFDELLFIDGNQEYDSSSDQLYIKFNNEKITVRESIKDIFIRLGYHRLTPIYIKFNLPDSLECIEEAGTVRIPISEEHLDEAWDTPYSLDFIDELFLDIEISFVGEKEKLNKLKKNDFLRLLIIESKIIENLKRYSPIQDVRFNDNINLYRDDLSILIDNIKIEFKLNNKWIPWSQLSDGTRRLFYLITEVTHAENGFVLIEEPELGVHPHQFNLLMSFLVEQSKDKQIIISTHSPKALDHLSPLELDQILITSYDSKKGTQLRHLSAREINKAKRYMKEVGFFSDYWMLSDLE